MVAVRSSSELQVCRTNATPVTLIDYECADIDCVCTIFIVFT